MRSWYALAEATVVSLVWMACSGSGGGSPPPSEATGGSGTTSGTPELCTDTCTYAADGECDDGGPGSLYSVCELGTDCTDCGPRGTSTVDAGSESTADWFTTPCPEMGGTLTAAGACGILCTSNADCPPETVCDVNDVWSVFNCEVTAEVRESRGCGPAGWRQTDYACALICSGEGNDSDCPSGFRCVEDAINDGEYFCTGYGGSAIGTAACSNCLSSCTGLSGCCTGVGCICESACS